jgi:putative glycosyltransferase
MKLSIVTTLYKSAPFIEEFVSRVVTASAKITDDVELVIVDDGSPDDALDKSLKLKQIHKNIKIIQLSRNFGHHEAILTGLQHADGDYVFLMDCDLEEAPEDLPGFFDKLKEQPDVDVVYGVQIQRAKGIIDRLFGRLYYWMFNFFSDIKIPENLTTTRLMSRNYVHGLLEHEEVDALLSGLWANTGFKQVPLEVEKVYKGNSTYNLRRQLKLIVRSITSFSGKPLVYIFYLGVIISLFAFAAILWFIYRKLFNHIGVGGWTSLFVSLWFIGGLLMLSIGVVGIYIERIFRQVKQRPRTIVKKIY